MAELTHEKKVLAEKTQALEARTKKEVKAEKDLVVERVQLTMKSKKQMAA